MRRRDFIAVVGGAVVAPALLPLAPFAAGAQDTAIPLIGFLHSGSASAHAELVGAFQEGLKGAGFVDGDNVAIAYQWADDDADRLPALAAELVRSHLAVLAAVGRDPALAAKAATSSMPVVFICSEDPVKLGLVASLARPGGNLTGVDIDTSELTAKRLDLLRALVPAAAHIALLVDPTDVADAESTVRNAEQAARWMGIQIRVLIASTSDEIDAAFDTIRSERLDALLVDLFPFFSGRRVQLVNLASSYAVPTIYGGRQFPQTGGLMSYGASLGEAYRQAGVYTGRILKGESPADMPVVKPTKVELVINLKTAKRLGLAVPPPLLAQAATVIE